MYAAVCDAVVLLRDGATVYADWRQRRKYLLALHGALPISEWRPGRRRGGLEAAVVQRDGLHVGWRQLLVAVAGGVATGERDAARKHWNDAAGDAVGRRREGATVDADCRQRRKYLDAREGGP